MPKAQIMIAVALKHLWTTHSAGGAAHTMQCELKHQHEGAARWMKVILNQKTRSNLSLLNVLITCLILS